MGTQPQHALHRTVVVVDVSAFGQRLRTPQEEIRRGLYAALESAFHDSGLDWSATHHEDRGDGVFVLVPAEVPKSRVVGGLPHALLGELRRYNATRNDDARLRLRMAITAGEVQHDEHGVVGDEVTLAFRLLDSDPLRAVLHRSTALIALIVSDRFYDDVVRPDPALDPGSFRRVEVRVKEVRRHAWLHVSNGSAPALEHRLPRHRRKRRAPRWAPVLLAVPLLFVGLTNGAGATPPAVPPCPPPVQLNVLVSKGKAEVVRALALEHEDRSGQRNALQCKEVSTLVTAGEAGAAEALGRGWPPGDLTVAGAEPHVWLPDTTAEVRPVEEALRERGDVRLEVRSGVAVSPVVLGASEDLAGRIAPDGEFDWKDVRAPAAVDVSSGAGVAAAAALARGRLGGSGLDSARALHGLVSGTTDEQPCAGEVAVVGSEQAVAGTTGCQVLYPRDGALVLDHPFVVVQRANRPNERRQRIVEDFYAYLLSPYAQDQFKRAGFRDTAWNVRAQAGPGVRFARPPTSEVEPDVPRVRAAWEAARARGVIAVVGDGSAEATAFIGEVGRLAGPRDRVIPLPLSAGVIEEAVAQGAHVVVVVSKAPIPALVTAVSRSVRAVSVAFEEGACAPSTDLSRVAAAFGGRCHWIIGSDVLGPSEGREEALDDIARAAWGG